MFSYLCSKKCKQTFITGCDAISFPRFIRFSTRDVVFDQQNIFSSYLVRIDQHSTRLELFSNEMDFNSWYNVTFIMFSNRIKTAKN